MKIQAIWLAALGQMVNDILQFDYDTKTNGIVWASEDMCKSMLAFVEQFNVAQKKLSQDIESIKARDKEITESAKLRKDEIVASFETMSEKERAKKIKWMQDDFIKVDEEAKAEKEALSKELLEINSQEFELPTILIDIEIPDRKTKQNYPLIPAKIMYAIDFFKDIKDKE